MSVRYLEDVARVVSDADIELKPVPPPFLFSVIEAASLEEDEDLHTRWVALLANAATVNFESEILPCFPDILKQLSSVEAQFLDKAYEDATKDEDKRQTFAMSIEYGLNEANQISGGLLNNVHPLVIDNLERLMLVSRNNSTTFSVANTQHERVTAASNRLYMRTLGKAFVNACRTPKKKG